MPQKWLYFSRVGVRGGVEYLLKGFWYHNTSRLTHFNFKFCVLVFFQFSTFLNLHFFITGFGVPRGIRVESSSEWSSVSKWPSQSALGFIRGGEGIVKMSRGCCWWLWSVVCILMINFGIHLELFGSPQSSIACIYILPLKDLGIQSSPNI